MEAIRNALATPFGLAMGLIYDVSLNYLLALVLITLLLRIVLVPLAVKQQKNSAKQMRLQAKVNKIRQRYAGQQGRDVQMKISQETQELYRREGFNASTAGCLPMALQLLVMMGLYGAIYNPLTKVLRIGSQNWAALKEACGAIGVELTKGREELDALNQFSNLLSDPRAAESIGKIGEEWIGKINDFVVNFKIFGIDLTATPREVWGSAPIFIVIPVLAGLTSLITALYTYLKQRKQNPEMAKNPAMGCMTLFSPLLSIWFSCILPAGVGFYWILSNILAGIQLIALDLTIKPANIIAGEMINETVQRRAREQSIKQRKALLEESKTKKV